MVDGVRIDNLPSTVLQNRAHVVPAMRDGLTVKLTIAQILGLLVSGDLTGKVAASAVSSTPAGTIAATNVQGAITELDGDVQTLSTNTGNSLALRLRADAAQSFTGPQQTQAQTNLGAATFFRTLFAAATQAAALTTLGVSTFIQTLIDDTDAATARATLGVNAALVGSLYASLAVSDIGSTIFAQNNQSSAYGPGDTIFGANLLYASLTSAGVPAAPGSALTGSYMAMGGSKSAGPTGYVSSFKRIA